MAQTALIKITIDPGKGIATINGVKVALNDLAKAQDQVNKSTEENNKIIEGSLKWHQMQINKLKAEQAAVSKSSEKYDTFNASIKRHNEAITEITRNRENETSALKGSFQYYENQIKMLRRQQKEFANTNEAVLDYEKRIQALRSSQRELATNTKLTGKGMQTMSTASGLAGAAATEFGRTIGDLPYGIQGVSNNIQQLTALFTDLVQAQGGVNKAFKVLVSTLMGPAGILVAVSLVTTAYEFFAKKQREAKEATEDFNVDLEAQILNLERLQGLYRDNNTTSEERVRLLKTLSGLEDDVVKAAERGLLTEEQIIKALDARLLLVNKQKELSDEDKRIQEEVVDLLAQREKAEGELEKINEKRTKFEAIAAKNRNTEQNNFLKNVESYVDFYENKVVEANKAIDDLVTGERNPLVMQLSEAQAELDSLSKIASDLLKDAEKNSVIVEGSIKDYEKRIETIKEEMANVDLQSEKYEQLDDELTKLTATYNDLLVTQRMLNIEILNNAMKAADMQIDAAMKAVTSEQALFAKRKELTMREQGRGDEFESWAINYYKSLKDNQAFTDKERLAFKEIYLNLLEKQQDREKKNAEKTANDVIKEEERKNKELIKTLENIKQTASTINDFLDAEAQREIDRETNKTNALNEQLRERLRNEELSKDERDRINQEIARNEAALVEKENAINERRFKQAKAFNIAMAVIDTYVAANQALRDETLVSTFAKIAAMVSIIGTGLANVATIARQQFVGRVAKTPTLRGDSSAAQTGPSFNVVGASTQNQLAEAITGQTNNPLRAYIVSSDVTTAQELDRKIVEGASI